MIFPLGSENFWNFSEFSLKNFLSSLTDISWNNWTSFCNEPIQIWAMLTIDHRKTWMDYFIFSQFYVVTVSIGDMIIFWWHGSVNMKNGFTIFDFDLTFLIGWLAVDFQETDRVWITNYSTSSIRTSLKMTLHYYLYNEIFGNNLWWMKIPLISFN